MSFSYGIGYDSSLLRGSDNSRRPWNLTDEILFHAGKQLKLLDIGCGTALKLIPLAKHFLEITGLDISEEMIDVANGTIKKYHLQNIKLLRGDSNNLPFKEKTYDIITCILSRWSIKEIYRVLKPNGVVIIEHIGCEDKKDFKIHFGKDRNGWRGQFINHQKDEYLQFYYDLFNYFFDSVSIKNGFWKTYYTKQGILELLRFTPTIRNFNLATDDMLLEKACKTFKYPKGIALTQNRILIYAQK